MQSLCVHENESVAVGECWSVPRRTVGKSDVRALDAQQRLRKQEWFSLGYRNITAKQWVGTIAVGDRVYELLPKLDREDEAGVRANLHLMLASGVLRGVDEAHLAPLLRAGKPLLVAYLEMFVRKLAAEWRRGPLRRYRVFEENVWYLKGKLLVSRQVRDNFLHPERFACARDELTVDNAPARLLKAAALVCARQQFAPALAASARALVAELDEVSDEIPVKGPALDVLERQHQRFAPLLEMAELILDAESPSTQPGGASTFALVFEMYTVFEAFIASELRRALQGFRVLEQSAARCLLERRLRGTWTGAFRLKPDVAVWAGDRIVALLDTKWKRLDPSRPWHGVSVADVYQMYAYATEYRCPLTVLVYPRPPGFERRVDEYRLSSSGSARPARIMVSTVNVSSDLSIPSVREALRNDLRATIDDAAT